mgnify:CR=1 FL=1
MEEALDPGHRVPDPVGIVGRRWGRRLQRTVEGVGETPEPLAPDRHHGHDRDPEALLEELGLHRDAQLVQLVHHVEDQHEGPAAVEELEGEGKSAGEVLGVHHVDEDVGGSPENVLLGDPLLLGAGHQGIGAGRVHDFQCVRAEVPVPMAQRHRGPRVVGHHHVSAREPVEEHALAHVGVAHERDPEPAGLRTGLGRPVAVGVVHGVRGRPQGGVGG